MLTTLTIMKILRRSSFLQALCFLFMVAIWNVSCSDEAMKAKCSQMTSKLQSSYNIANKLEIALDMVRTLDRTYDYSSVQKGYEDIFGESQEVTDQIAVVQQEMDLYGQLGYSGYTNLQLQNGVMETDLHTEFINFESELHAALMQEPSLSEFITFISTLKSNIPVEILCASEVKVLNDFYDLVQGSAQYFYGHYQDAKEKGNKMGCNFFEGLGCFLLATIVAIIGTIVGIILFIGAIVIGPDGGGPLGDDQAALLALALGIYLGYNFYKWCCGKDEVDKQDCKAPTASILKPISCNSFRYTITGPSNYSNTNWTNSNLTPATASTTTPSLVLSVFNNDPLAIHAEIACVEDATTAILFVWDDTPTFDIPGNITLAWVNSPQSAVPVGTWSSLKVNTPNGVPYTYQWTISNGNYITGSGNSVLAKYINVGYSNVNVQVTNTCTNQVQMLSGGTYVYQ